MSALDEKYDDYVVQPPPLPRPTPQSADKPSLADRVNSHTRPANTQLFPKSWPCRALIIVVFLEAVIDIAVQANLLWRFNLEQANWELGGEEIEQRRLPYFVGIFAAAQ